MTKNKVVKVPAVKSDVKSDILEISCWDFHIYSSKGSVYRREPGGRLNKKDGLTRYGDSHVKDKTS